MRKARIHWFAWICWLGAAIWICTVFWLSSHSSGELSATFPFINLRIDKALHFAAYFCGALPFVPGFRLSTDWSWKMIFWISVACVSGYGALDEVHQLWTPTRSGLSFNDWIADTLGALVGAAVAVAVHVRIERRTSPPAPERMERNERL